MIELLILVNKLAVATAYCTVVRFVLFVLLADLFPLIMDQIDVPVVVTIGKILLLPKAHCLIGESLANAVLLCNPTYFFTVKSIFLIWLVRIVW